MVPVDVYSQVCINSHEINWWHDVLYSRVEINHETFKTVIGTSIGLFGYRKSKLFTTAQYAYIIRIEFYKFHLCVYLLLTEMFFQKLTPATPVTTFEHWRSVIIISCFYWIFCV